MNKETQKLINEALADGIITPDEALTVQQVNDESIGYMKNLDCHIKPGYFESEKKSAEILDKVFANFKPKRQFVEVKKNQNKTCAAN